MSRTRLDLRSLLAVVAIAAFAGDRAGAQVFTYDGLIAKHNPFRPYDPAEPVTVVELCQRLDCLAEELRNDGLVTMKQPDVFSQARMTRFRTDFETQMASDLASFHLVLAARINRLDAATTTSQTALSAALAPGSTSITTAPSLPALPTSTATGVPSGANGVTLPLTGPFNNTTGGLGVGANFFAPTPSGATAANAPLALGVDPTVYLDEKKRFLEHLNQIRRISLGPDQNDSSGYGLYLVRLPVSITPGECTYQGHGADFSVHVEHEFPPDFLPTSFRSLVINDLTDVLGPHIYEVIRSGTLDKLKARHAAVALQKRLLLNKDRLLQSLRRELERAICEPMIRQIGQNQRGTAGYVDPLDPVAGPLTGFILRESHPATGDPTSDAQTWSTVADRLTVLADAWATVEAAHGGPDPVAAQGLADFRRKIEAVRRGEGIDVTIPGDAKELVRSLLRRYLKTNLSDRGSAEAFAGLSAADRWKILDWNALLPFLGQLYGTVLLDDMNELNVILGLSPAQGTTVNALTTQIAQVNLAIGGDHSLDVRVSLPSARADKARYPISPREVLDFFLEDNIYLIAEDVQRSLRTRTPRASDVRNYLRHNLGGAYQAMSGTTQRQVPPPPPPLADVEFMEAVREAIRERQFKDAPNAISGLKALDDQLLTRLEATRDNIRGRLIGALCWAIAVDAAVLDEALRRDARKVFEANGMAADPIDAARFYLPSGQPNDDGRFLFNEYVRVRWPIVTFSLDPVTDQQNIADSFNLKRDLQLAVSFAFATGQIGFNQLNTFRRQIEQSADTIALNRTVTGFTTSNDMFGFRFTPRYQNPPNQRTNIGVVASQLIGGGPGPDYGIKKSKLEPGMRELTAVLLLPTFLPTMRMNVAGNWFKLNDPEHLVFHTKRMMEQGRRVQELRRAVVDACSAGQYRDADRRVLESKLALLEAMLPMQSRVVQLPFDNAANGFDLFSDGSTALVPELTGYSGVDVIQPAPNSATQAAVQVPATAPGAGATVPVSSSGITLTSNTTTSSSSTTTVSTVGGTGSIGDVFVTGKYLSILDSKVIAGGRSAAFEILSREVVHVQVPVNAAPTTTEDGQTYIEIYMATPNGISNSILVPYAVPTPVATAYDVDPKSQSFDIFYQWATTPDGGHSLIATADPGKAITIDWTSAVAFAPKTLQATLTATVGSQAVTVVLPADTGVSGNYTVDLHAYTVSLLKALEGFTQYPTSLPATASVTVQVQPYLPDPSAGFRVNTNAITLPSKITLNLIFNATGTNALPGVFPIRPAPPAAKATTSALPAARPGALASGPRDPGLIRTAQPSPDLALPPLPTTFSAPTPPDLLQLPAMQPPASSAEAAQVTRLLTGQPLLPNAPPPTPAGIQALAPNLAATVPAAALAPAAAGAGPASPIVVMPAPVVVVGPKPEPKKGHKSLFRSPLFNRNGQRTGQ